MSTLLSAPTLKLRASLCAIFCLVCPSSAWTACQANQAMTRLLSSQKFLYRAGLLLRTAPRAQIHPTLPFPQPPTEPPCLLSIYIPAAFTFRSWLPVFCHYPFLLNTILASLCRSCILVQTSDHFSSGSRSRKQNDVPRPPDWTSVISPRLPRPHRIPFPWPSSCCPLSLKPELQLSPHSFLILTRGCAC